jgi:hypothetical protein
MLIRIGSYCQILNYWLYLGITINNLLIDHIIFYDYPNDMF